jgi:hypothetical protein
VGGTEVRFFEQLPFSDAEHADFFCWPKKTGEPDIMGDNDHGSFFLPPKLAQHLVSAHLVAGIEMIGRLVDE